MIIKTIQKQTIHIHSVYFQYDEKIIFHRHLENTNSEQLHALRSTPSVNIGQTQRIFLESFVYVEQIWLR